MRPRHARWLILVACLLFGQWATRLPSLDALPLHNDEGLHLTRAVEVWHLHPFWEISDGKIVNHWPIALFYPQNAPVHAGRLPTVLLSLIGLAAGLALARRLFGAHGALLAGLLWIATPYLFFYERLALSDAEAGALIVLAVWGAIRFAERGSYQDAALAGIGLALAVLFKFTAAPFALSIGLVLLLWGRIAPRRRIEGLLIVAAIGVAAFAVPLGYLVLKGDDLSIALGWIGGGSGKPLFSGIGANLALLGSQIRGFGLPLWALAIGAGLVALGLWREAEKGRRGIVLLAAVLIPPASMIILASEIEPRHFVVVLPLAITLGGGALGELISRRAWGVPGGRWLFVGASGALLLAACLPFTLLAYRAPGDLPLPERVRGQYVVDHSAGFGLREAVLAFPETIGAPGGPIIASMFPDSCKRANFYDIWSYAMQCPAAPGTEAIAAALADGGPVYVLREAAPVGLTDEALAALGHAERLASYPRPGESEATAVVTLWRITP